MPVHAAVPPAHLSAALESLAAQTRPPDDLVVVEDGPLDAELLLVLANFSPPFPVHRLALERPSGIAAALQHGLTAMTTTWVARADSDDINEPHRLECQMAALAATSCDVLGSTMLEFETDPLKPAALRIAPTHHDAIARRMRWANPVNHPTVVVRREAAQAAGGFRPLPGLEDYDLWARMLVAGARFGNLPQPLVRFRGGPAMLSRRRSLPTLRGELTLQRRLHDLGLVSWPRALLNLVLRTGFRLLPGRLLASCYRLLFQRRVG